jgi:phosphatidylglycerophosphatase C
MARPDKTQRTWVALFDLDGTITYRDTLLPFLVGFMRRHPLRLLRLWQLPAALWNYVLERDRGALKSRMIRMAMGGMRRETIEAWADFYVGGLERQGRLRPIALKVITTHREAGDKLVLLSASPDIYVPKIGAMLGFDQTFCTELIWDGERLDGRLRTPNRRGPEKTRCLNQVRKLYKDLPVIAYGNASSDLDHMRKADSALLVNGDAAARKAATALEIPTSEWP